MTEQHPKPVTAELANRPKRGLSCVWIVLVLIGLLMTTIVFVARYALLGAPLQLGKETTYITAPLKSQGTQVDYFAAWELETYPQEIAADDNGFRLIVQHFGAAPDSTAGHFAEVCQKLGLDGDAIVPDRKFEEPYDFFQAYVESADFDATVMDRLSGDEASQVEPAEDQFSEDGMEGGYPGPMDILHDRINRPWTLDDLPMMEIWLAENGPALDIVHEAVRKPEYHIPLARETEHAILITLPLPDAQHQRSFARGLSARANFRIGTGNIDGAIDDIVACKRLGRHVGSEGVLLEMLVGIAIEGIADSIGIASSLEHPPTKDQLERLANELNNLPPVGEYKKALLFERYASLDIIQSMAHGNTSLTEFDFPGWMARLGFDWNLIARRINVRHDAIVGSGALASPEFRPHAILSSRARSEMLADTLGVLLEPTVDAGIEATRRRECVERMHRVILAMLLYHADNGKLPSAHTIDAGGNPLHSWRVLLLPYLGQQALYGRVRLNEPWNSEHNRTLHDEAIPFYQCPSAELSPGQTTYSVVVGPEMPFEGAVNKRLADFGPKSAAMVLVVERKQPVCWMDPTMDVPQEIADVGIHTRDGHDGEIGSDHPGGANFGLRGGACQFLSETLDPAVFEGLLRGTVEEVP